MALAFDARGNRSACGCELYGVVQDIDDGLPHIKTVGLRADALVSGKRERQMLVLDEDLQERCRFSHERHKWEDRHLHPDLSRICSREHEQAFDNAVQLVALFYH